MHEMEMEIEKGRVIKIINSKSALVKVESMGECSECSGKAGCSIFNKNENIIEAGYQDSLETGDEVEIIIKPKNRILLSLIIFFIPVVFLIISYYLGLIIFKNEKIAPLISFSGFLISFVLIIFILRIIKKRGTFIPVIHKIK